MEFLKSLQDSSFSLTLQGSSIIYYLILAVHAIGMAGVVGGSIMLSLRILGFAIGIPASALERLRTIASWCFVANAISGALIFITNPVELIELWTFQLKMACIVAGGGMLFLLWRQIEPFKADGQHRFDFKAKLTAALTIGLWIGAIVSGRYIAYTIQPGL